MHIINVLIFNRFAFLFVLCGLIPFAEVFRKLFWES